MSINWSTGIIKQVRQIAVKSFISMDKFSDTDIKEFLTVFDKAMKKVNKKKQDEIPAFPTYKKI